MIDKVKLYYDIPSLCQITAPGMFQRKLGYGKVWHKYNTDKGCKQTSYYPFVVHNQFSIYPNPQVPNSKRHTIKRLEVEVSLPKIVYGQNLYELTNRQYRDVRQSLAVNLKQMGIVISPATIGMGTVQSVEFSKNMLTGRIPGPFILDELYCAKPLNNFMDVERSSYRNNGEQLTFYCQGYSVVFYDKGKEILKQIQNKPQLLPHTLVQGLKTGTYNILRMEVRFHNRETLLAFLNKHGFQKYNHGLLEDVYSMHIAKYVLNYYWGLISQTARQNSPFILSPNMELYHIRKAQGNKHTLIYSLATLGVRHLLRECGYKGAQKALKTIGDRNPAQTLRQYISCVYKPCQKLDVWKFMDKSLSMFRCLNRKAWGNIKQRASGPWFEKKEALLSVKEAAQWLNVSAGVVRKAIHSLKLKACKIGSQYRISRYNLVEYMHAI